MKTTLSTVTTVNDVTVSMTSARNTSTTAWIKKALWRLSLVVMSLGAASGSAKASEVSWDGDYRLNHQAMEMNLQCGQVLNGQVVPVYAQTLDLSLDESMMVPAGTFDEAEAAVVAQVEARGLSARQEAAALQAVSRFFDAMERGMNRSLASLPEEMTITAQSTGSTQLSYNFTGLMTDEASGRTVQAPGTMSRAGGVFSLVPFYAAKPVEKSQVLTMVSGGFQLGGAVSEGLGELAWTTQALMVAPSNAQTYGCMLSNRVDFELEGALVGQNPSLPTGGR